VSSSVGAASPHTNHGCRLEVPESIDDDGMVTEMLSNNAHWLAIDAAASSSIAMRPPLRPLVGRTECSKIKKLRSGDASKKWLSRDEGRQENRADTAFAANAGLPAHFAMTTTAGQRIVRGVVPTVLGHGCLAYSVGEE
jgi:hypothetical protein